MGSTHLSCLLAWRMFAQYIVKELVVQLYSVSPRISPPEQVRWPCRASSRFPETGFSDKWRNYFVKRKRSTLKCDLIWPELRARNMVEKLQTSLTRKKKPKVAAVTNSRFQLYGCARIRRNFYANAVKCYCSALLRFFVAPEEAALRHP